jgi:signal transduction histidine kinase
MRSGLLVRIGREVAFLHDRVHEAAYSLVPPGARPDAHLAIGRLLLSRLPDRAIDERIFEVATQLNRGRDRITDPGEKALLRDLDVRAAEKARKTAAYSSARVYFNHAAALLPSNAWTAVYGEAFALELGLGECDYLVGDFATAEARLGALRDKARSEADRARIEVTRAHLYQLSGRFGDAWSAVRHALERFGITFPARDDEVATALDQEVARIRAELASRRVADLPELTAPDLRLVPALFIAGGVPAYNAWPQAWPLHWAKAVRFTLEHGRCVESCTFFALYASVLAARGEIKAACDLSDAALRLADQYDDPWTKLQVRSCDASQISHWRRHLASSIPPIAPFFAAAQERGDVVSAGIIAIITAWSWLDKGTPLDELRKVQDDYLASARESHNDVVAQTLRLMQQYVACLRGKTLAPASFDDDTFTERAFLETVSGARFLAGVSLHRILKEMAAFVYGRFDEALDAAEQKPAALGAAGSFLYEATHRFYAALTKAALYTQASEEQREAFARDLREEEQRHASWARHCPDNFRDRHALLSAEIARIERRDLDAERLYEAAIESARRSGFVQNEALGLERASCFYRARGFTLTADAYIREARAAYLRWGASGKVLAIDAAHPDIAETVAASPPAPVSGTFEARSEQLDLFSVVKASQTISSEFELEKLVGTLLGAVLEHCGARRACLALVRDGALRLMAEGVVAERQTTTHLLEAVPLDASALVPTSLVDEVTSTKKPVIIDDAASPGSRLEADPGAVERHARSVLCYPIVRGAELVGVLYLENDLASGVFTPERLTTLSLLASQVAISVENALALAAERKVRIVAQEAEARAAFLADAGATLAASLDYEETLPQVARMCVRSLADVCTIDVLEGAELRRYAVAHRDPSITPILRELERRYPLRSGSRRPPFEVLRTRAPLVVQDPSPEVIRRYTDDDEHARLVAELSLRSFCWWPLRARGEVLGVLALGSRQKEHYHEFAVGLAGELATRVAVAVDNARLYREAQHAIRLRDEFLSTASHELRTPLTSLQLVIEGLVRGARQMVPGASPAMLDVALRQTGRLTTLVGQLLDVSRIQGGKLRLELEDVELVSLGEQILERIRVQSAASGAPIRLHTRGPIWGHWDRSRVDQLLTNLLSNALVYGERRPVDLTLTCSDDRARIEVRDEGIGIPEDRLPHVFERFERATSTRNFGGLGLGLFIAREIVQAHGGAISVVSKVGRGSTFTVDLPLRSVAEEVAAGSQ